MTNRSLAAVALQVWALYALLMGLVTFAIFLGQTIQEPPSEAATPHWSAQTLVYGAAHVVFALLLICTGRGVARGLLPAGPTSRPARTGGVVAAGIVSVGVIWMIEALALLLALLLYAPSSMEAYEWAVEIDDVKRDGALLEVGLGGIAAVLPRFVHWVRSSGGSGDESQ